MGYICIKPMKVQRSDGQVEMRRPGDPVPEAEAWANPAVWIKRGYIAPTDAETANASGYARSKLKPMISADEAAKARAASYVPKSGEPIPGLGDSENGSDDRGLDDDPLKDLLELTRDDLNALAEEHGVDEAGKMPNKNEVAKAILAAQVAAG